MSFGLPRSIFRFLLCSLSLIQSTLGNHPWLFKPQALTPTHNFKDCRRYRHMHVHSWKHIPLESNIFCGLTSKWTIYFECINSSAWANCLVKFFDSSSVKVFRSPTQYSKISPPIALKIILECQIFLFDSTVFQRGRKFRNYDDTIIQFYPIEELPFSN